MDEDDGTSTRRHAPRHRRLAWLLGPWLGGVVVFSAFVYLIRWLLAP